MKKMEKKTEVLEALKTLKTLMKQTKANRVYVEIPHVARSGMSRIIKFKIITKKGELLQLDYLIHVITGYGIARNYYDGLRVQGCGMDMVFKVLYDVNYVALKYGVIRASKNKTEHDLKYRGLVDSTYYYL